MPRLSKISKISNIFRRKGKASMKNRSRVQSSDHPLKKSIMNRLTRKKTRKLKNQPPHPYIEVSITHDYGPKGGIIYKCKIRNKTTLINFDVFSDEDLEKISGELKDAFPTDFTKKDLKYIDNELFRKKKGLNTIVKWKAMTDRTRKSRAIASTFNRTSRLNKRVSNPLSLSYPYLLNPEYFEKRMIPLSSTTDSASDSMVYLVKTRSKLTYRFIIKITYVDDSEVDPDNYPATEFKIYKIMNDLIKYNITPYVFRGISKIDTFQLGDINDQDLKTDLLVEMNLSQQDNVFVIMNETNTGEHNDIKSLFDFLENLMGIILNEKKYDVKEAFLVNLRATIYCIMFQIMYTLCVFNKINLRHNDLHQGNIMLIIDRKNNIFETLNTQYYTKFVFDDNKGNIKKIFLPNIGIDVRIYDFDRSCKTSSTKKYPKIKCKYLEENYSILHYCDKNKHFDSFTVLGQLYNYLNMYMKQDTHVNTLLMDVKEFIEGVFTTRKLLTHGLNKHGEQIDINKGGNIKYHLTKEPKGDMDTPHEIVEKIIAKLELEKKDSNIDVLTTFDIRDCNKI